jgi:GNAT superfamily N-acetyltransferase
VGVAGPFGAGCHQVTPTVRIERLDPADAPALGAMFAAIDPWKRYPVTAAELTGFFATVEPGAPRFSIRLDDRLAGAVAIRVAWLRGPYIQTFALDPTAQGQGIGSAVMAWIATEARLADSCNLWVAASDFNDGAHRFYARHGFVRVGALDGLLRDDISEILLRKKLATAPSAI